MMTNIILARIGTNPTIKYAFDELARYLKQMDSSIFIDSRVYNERDLTRNDIIWVGLDGSVPTTEDDTIFIDVTNGGGIVTGSNERSVLMAVYRFLFELGCRWIYPGKDGEKIPSLTLTKEFINVKVNESPSYRHRGICMEGEINCEHVYDMLDWMPKVGMNSYFVQFQTPGEFFKRWYNRPRPSTIPLAPVTDDDIDHMVTRLEEEIAKRDMHYHAVGHTWTCESFGVHVTDWMPVDTPPPAEMVPHIALIDGERKFWHGQPLNTQLCYSQKATRDILTDNVLDYCQKHPVVTHIVFWLADGENNCCECTECSKMRSSNYYVTILNELDEKLTENDINVKVIFGAGTDSLWAPDRVAIKNPDRFIILFAPITRTYSKAFIDYDKSERSEVTSYVHNKNVYPKSVGANLVMLEKWQDYFKGDSLIFDYHLYEAHYFDAGSYNIAKILHTDMANLDQIGLNGMISCQVNQAAFPTGLPQYAMTKALWNKKSDFKDICDEYYTADFGNLGVEVDTYLRKLSDLLDLYKFEEHKNQDIILKNCDEAKALINDFSDKFIKKYKNKSNNWKYLMHHSKMCLLYCDLIVACTLGDDKTKDKLVQKQRKYISDHKHEIHNVFDTTISRHTAVLNHMINIVSNANLTVAAAYEGDK